MRACKCCDRQLSGDSSDRGSPSPPMRSHRLLRRAIGLVEWLVPAATLALIPKCPLCIAAYVAIGTGLGISVSTASYLRIGLIGVCIAALVYLAWRKIRIVLRTPRRA
jgi:hypothetical protein